jgi:hypothetical protein
MSRRHLHFVIALLLPLMVLRGLLPAGYMPFTQEGALRIVLCGEGLQQSGADHAPAGSHHNDDCPFALASGLAPPTPLFALPASPAPLLRLPARRFAQQSPAFAPLRHEAARGPPARSVTA